MKAVRITIDFANGTGGQANVKLLGPGLSHNYLISKADSRNIDLPAGAYAIQVYGTSAGDLDLSIDEGGNNLLKRTCSPMHLFIIGNFTISIPS